MDKIRLGGDVDSAGEKRRVVVGKGLWKRKFAFHGNFFRKYPTHAFTTNDESPVNNI